VTDQLELVVTGRRTLADGVLGLTLARADGDPLPAWEPGAHVDLVLGPDLVRQYSLCGEPADRRAWRVAVLREPAGRGGSAFVHDRLAVGDRVAAHGPRNRFPLVPSPDYLFIAGGIGITPILPMLAAAERAGAAWRLVYGGRRRASMAFVPALRRYGDRVEIRPQDECGLLDLDSLLGAPAPGTLVYCCGPEPLLVAVERRCRDWPDGSLHVERFAAAPAGPTAPGVEIEVELRASGRVLTVPAGTSILRAVEEAGVAVLSSCREGTCGTCETDVLDGVPDHRDTVLTDAERAAGDVMMICVSRSLTPRLVLDL
jgi:ferredoxin-NADP reductase